MSSFFKNLSTQLVTNGKFLIGYVMTQVPGITSVPGIKTAFTTAVTDHTLSSYLDLGVQVLLVIAAAHRGVKLVTNAQTDTAIQANTVKY